jgi:hypothetical protein
MSSRNPASTVARFVRNLLLRIAWRLRRSSISMFVCICLPSPMCNTIPFVCTAQSSFCVGGSRLPRIFAAGDFNSWSSAGGMGRIYRAEDTRLGREVALSAKDTFQTHRLAEQLPRGRMHQDASAGCTWRSISETLPERLVTSRS